MALLANMEVTLTLSTDVFNCERCGAPARLFVHPRLICANCWSLDVLRKEVEELSGFVHAVDKMAT